MATQSTMSDPNSAALAGARKQGMMVGLVIGLIVGAVCGGLVAVFMPEMTQSAPKIPTVTKRPANAVPTTPVACSTSGQAAARVLTVKNTGSAALNNVVLDVTRPRTRETKHMDLGTLAPGASKDLGAKEWDWQMTQGDVVEVSAEGFAAMSYTEP